MIPMKQKNVKHQPTTPEVAASKLAREIVKSHGHLRVQIGRTNGKPVLHVHDKPGARGRSFTIKNLGEWLNCPLNYERVRRDRATAPSENTAQREAEINQTSALIANRDAI